MVLLILNIPLDGFSGDVAHRFAVIAARPKGGYLLLDPRELHSKSPGGRSLQLLDDEVGAVYRGGLDEQVDMIRHDLHRLDVQAHLLSLAGQEDIQAGLNVAGQKFPPVLGAPDQVIADIEDGFVACRPTGVHVNMLPHHNTSGNCIMLHSCSHPTTKVGGFHAGGS